MIKTLINLKSNNDNGQRKKNSNVFMDWRVRSTIEPLKVMYHLEI